MTSTAATPGDVAVVTVRVRVDPPTAFRVFTDEIDRWWRPGLRFRTGGGAAGRSVVALEPGVGGRLFETIGAGPGARVVETGRVLAWDPPRRLVLAWRAVNFAEPDPSTEVEVEFAPTASGTLVTVRHRGWASVRADHPVRHAQPVPAFLAGMGRWWGDLLTALREIAEGVGPAGPT